jgi:hypothetical protein
MIVTIYYACLSFISSQLISLNGVYLRRYVLKLRMEGAGAVVIIIF